MATLAWLTERPSATVCAHPFRFDRHVLMKRLALTFLFAAAGACQMPALAAQIAHGGNEPTALHAEHAAGPAPIHFHYFDAKPTSTPAKPMDAKALQTLGQHWVTQCSQGGQFADLAATFAPNPALSAKEREALPKRFDRTRFEALAIAAWRKANAVLPQAPLNLCVELVDAHSRFVDKAMRGVAGLTAGSGKIMLKVSVDADWARMLPFALAHELHHSYWASHDFDPAKPFTLADYLVFEGRADYFAHSLYPDTLAPWDKALTDDQFATLWPRLHDDMGSTDFAMMRAVMFGDPRHDIPQWAGYSIGYRLVSQRMQRKPNMDIQTMTASPASAFLPATPAENHGQPNPH